MTKFSDIRFFNLLIFAAHAFTSLQTYTSYAFQLPPLEIIAQNPEPEKDPSAPQKQHDEQPGAQHDEQPKTEQLNDQHDQQPKEDEEEEEATTGYVERFLAQYPLLTLDEKQSLKRFLEVELHEPSSHRAFHKMSTYSIHNRRYHALMHKYLVPHKNAKKGSIISAELLRQGFVGLISRIFFDSMASKVVEGLTSPISHLAAFTLSCVTAPLGVAGQLVHNRLGGKQLLKFGSERLDSIQKLWRHIAGIKEPEEPTTPVPGTAVAATTGPSDQDNKKTTLMSYRNPAEEMKGSVADHLRVAVRQFAAAWLEPRPAYEGIINALKKSQAMYSKAMNLKSLPLKEYIQALDQVYAEKIAENEARWSSFVTINTDNNNNNHRRSSHRDEAHEYAELIGYLSLRHNILMSLPSHSINLADDLNHRFHPEAQLQNQSAERLRKIKLDALKASYPSNNYQGLDALIRRIKNNSSPYLEPSDRLTAAYFYGAPGTGKTRFVEMLGKILGLHVCHLEIKGEDLSEQLFGSNTPINLTSLGKNILRNFGMATPDENHYRAFEPERRQRNDYSTSDNPVAYVGKLAKCFIDAGHTNPIIFIDEATDQLSAQNAAMASQQGFFAQNNARADITAVMKDFLGDKNSRRKLMALQNQTYQIEYELDLRRATIIFAGNSFFEDAAIRNRLNQFEFGALEYPQRFAALENDIASQIKQMSSHMYKDPAVKQLMRERILFVKRHITPDFLDFFVKEEMQLGEPGARKLLAASKTIIDYIYDRFLDNPEGLTEETLKAYVQEHFDSIKKFNEVVEKANRRNLPRMMNPYGG